jgi:hypothetical protein
VLRPSGQMPVRLKDHNGTSHQRPPTPPLHTMAGYRAEATRVEDVLRRHEIAHDLLATASLAAQTHSNAVPWAMHPHVSDADRASDSSILIHVVRIRDRLRPHPAPAAHRGREPAFRNTLVEVIPAKPGKRPPASMRNPLASQVAIPSDSASGWLDPMRRLTGTRATLRRQPPESPRARSRGA